jgi:hypothetical protein
VAIDGVARVQSRISEIQARIAALHGQGLGPASTGWGPGLRGAGSGTAGSFANAYQVALGTTTSASSASAATLGGVSLAATVKPVGSYGKLQAPAELARYGNGRIPDALLTPLGTGSHELYAPAAAAWKQMVADARAQGVSIGLTDSYRSYDQQVDVAGRKGLYSQGGLAATPGTSNHGWGMAVDADVDAQGQQWLRDNGWKYGWVESVPREPWHWEFRPAAGVSAFPSTDAIGAIGVAS